MMNSRRTPELDPVDTLAFARECFEAGFRPVPVRWKDDGEKQFMPGAPDKFDEERPRHYSELKTRAMTEEDFENFFIRKGKLRREVEGFGILMGPDTGGIGWDIDRHDTDGFAWLKLKGIPIPTGFTVATPRRGLHVAQRYPDDPVPKKNWDMDLGNILAGAAGEEHQIGVEVKANRTLFIVAGPGYVRQNSLAEIGRSPAGGPLLDIVMGREVAEFSDDGDIFNHSGAGTFVPPKLGRKAEKALRLRLGSADVMYRYDGGVYRPDGDELLASFVRSELKDEFRENKLREVRAYI